MANCADRADGRLKTRLSRDGRRWERIRALWRDDPWIVHYAGPHKPWRTERPIAHGYLWWDYARRSAAWSRLAPALASYDDVCRRAAEKDRPLLSKLLNRVRR